MAIKLTSECLHLAGIRQHKPGDGYSNYISEMYWGAVDPTDFEGRWDNWISEQEAAWDHFERMFEPLADKHLGLTWTNSGLSMPDFQNRRRRQKGILSLEVDPDFITSNKKKWRELKRTAEPLISKLLSRLGIYADFADLKLVAKDQIDLVVDYELPDWAK